jgi:hypothetical protein
METAYSQYKTVVPLVAEGPSGAWLSDEDKARIASYIKYDEIYWGEDTAFRLIRRGSEQQPLYIPTPRTIVDNTAHYYLKGLTVTTQNTRIDKILKTFLKREKFFSRFAVAKHTGVAQGDWIVHITADPDLDEGERVSMTTVSPACYFPVYDDDDPTSDKVIKVHLATAFKDGEDGKDALHRLTYSRELVNGKKRIGVEEKVYRLDVLWKGTEPPLKRTIQDFRLLPETITAIPVYHFRNMDWADQPFGSSELRGFERLAGGINQTMSDEEIALALDGLGVYATDAGRPEDEDGKETEWTVGPGSVEEVPLGSYFKRVEGVGSVTPMLDHVKFIQDTVYEASGVFRTGGIDVAVAQSGISLAIRFLPTMAKLEHRDEASISTLEQMWFDWTFWMEEYEDAPFGGSEDIVVKLGDKLPMDRDKRVSELNNMYDRKIISRKYYRSEMEKLGYEFPDDIESEIQDEAQQAFEMAQKQAELTGFPPGGGGGPPAGDPTNPNAPSKAKQNGSRNQRRVNESNGTEAGHSSARTAKRSPASNGR